MGPPARRLGAWSLALLLVLVACSGGEEPRSAPASGAPTSTPSASDQELADTAAAAVEERLDIYEGAYPGALVLLRFGEETRFVTAGYADLRSRTAMTDRHRFQIGSVTKTMVAAALMQLVETEEVRLALATSEPPPYAPDDTSSYSNTNYLLLGLLLERATGQDLATVLQERVFAPLDMSDTSLLPARVTEQPLVRGYDGQRDVTLDRLASCCWGAGGVVSSARDLDAFIEAFFAGRLVGPGSVQEMSSSRGFLVLGGSGYGLGVGLQNTRAVWSSATAAVCRDSPRKPGPTRAAPGQRSCW